MNLSVPQGENPVCVGVPVSSMGQADQEPHTEVVRSDTAFGMIEKM